MSNLVSKFSDTLNKTMTERIGGNIIKLCKERQWTLKKLSQESGVPLSTLHGYTANKNPKISHLKKICTALEVSIHELLYGTPDPFEKPGNEILKHLFEGDLRVTIKKIERLGDK